MIYNCYNFRVAMIAHAYISMLMLIMWAVWNKFGIWNLEFGHFLRQKNEENQLPKKFKSFCSGWVGWSNQLQSHYQVKLS